MVAPAIGVRRDRIAYMAEGTSDWSLSFSGDVDSGVAAHHNGQMYGVAGRDGVLRYSDTGTRWNAHSGFNALWDIHYGGAGRWVVVGEAGEMVTFTNIATLNNLFVLDPVSFDHANFSTVFLRKFNARCTWFAGTEDGVIWKSEDPSAGSGWSAVFTVEGGERLNDFAMDPDTGTLFVCGNNRTMLFSEDNGESWNQVDLPEGDVNFYQLAYSPTFNLWMSSVGEAGVAVSLDWTSGLTEFFEPIPEHDAIHENIRGAGWSDPADMFVVSSASSNTMLGVVPSDQVPTSLAAKPLLSSHPFLEYELNTYEAAHTGAAGDTVAVPGVPKICSCPSYERATALGRGKVGLPEETILGGRSAGKGLYKLTGHVDTMWCRRTGGGVGEPEIYVED